MNYGKFTKQQLITLLEKETRYSIKYPDDVRDFLSNYIHKVQECFLVITLDSKHNVIKCHEVTMGLVNKTLAHPREVFRPAILDNAVAIIVAHNHPSGEVSPSKEDINLTKRLFDASEIIGISLLDHVIVGKTFYSIKENSDFDFLGL